MRPCLQMTYYRRKNRSKSINRKSDQWQSVGMWDLQQGAPWRLSAQGHCSCCVVCSCLAGTASLAMHRHFWCYSGGVLLVYEWRHKAFLNTQDAQAPSLQSQEWQGRQTTRTHRQIKFQCLCAPVCLTVLCTGYICIRSDFTQDTKLG